MNQRSDSREDILKELQKLRKENIAIKAQYDKIAIECKQAEKELKEVHQKLTDVQSVAKVGSWEVDLCTFEVKGSEETFLIFDLDRQSHPITISFFLNFIHSQDLAILNEAFRKSISTNSINTIQHRIITVKGNLKYIVENWRIDFSEDGTAIRAHGNCSDITERKLSEEELKISGIRFRTIFDDAPLGIALIDSLSGRICEANPMYAKIAGRTLEEMVHMDWISITHPDDIQLGLEHMALLIKGEINGFNLEKRYIRPDGSIVWINMTISHLIKEDNLPLRHLCMIEDITERKQSMELIEMLKKSIDVLREGAYWMDQDFNFVYINEAGSKILGYTNDELLGKSVVKINPEATPEKIGMIRELVIKDGSFKRESIHRRKDGTRLPVEISTSYVKYDNKEYFCGIATDITKRKEAELNLENERLLLRTVIDNIPDSIYCMDLEGRKTLANLTDLRYMGATSEAEVLGKNDFAFYPEELAKEFFAIDQKVMQTNQPLFNIEESLIDENGIKVWLLSSKIPMHNIDGQVVGLLGIGRDITQRKLAEDQVRKLSIAIEQSPVSIVITNMEGTIEYANPNACMTTGYSREELYGNNPRILKSGETPSEEYRVLWETISHGNSWQGTFHNRRKNGELYWEMSSISPILDEKGKITNYLAIKEDITERKRIEDVLQSKTSFLEAQINATNEGILIVDQNKNKILTNQRFIDLFNLPAPITEDGNGNSLLEYIGSLVREPESFLEKVNYLNENIKEVGMDEIVFKNGLVLYMYSAPIIGVNGKCYGRIWTFLDITESKNAEIEIKHKNKELQKVNAEKDKFFSIIAHDLRNPFNGFLGLTEVVAKDLHSMTMDEIHEISILLNNSASNLYELLGNLLEWSQIQRGLIEVVPTSFLLLPRILECLNPIIEEANKKKILFELDVPEGLSVFSDKNMLESIMRNLSTNAIKFTPVGGKIVVAAKSDINYGIEISIKDTGIGMSRKMVDDLFRIDVNTSRKGTQGEPSTGMGLIICKDLIEKLGGQLNVESEEGIGSEFRFILPSLKDNLILT